MRSKLYCLKEHKTQRYVKNIPKQEFYAQKLALKRAKKIRDPNMYSGENPLTLDKYISQINLVF